MSPPDPLSGRAHIRVPTTALSLLAAITFAAAAQDPEAVSGVTVDGRKAATCPAEAHSIDYACLTTSLRAAASGSRPAPPAIDATAREATTPSRVGTFSHAAVAERMGQNFGRSATPYRPPAPAYANPIPSGRAPR